MAVDDSIEVSFGLDDVRRDCSDVLADLGHISYYPQLPPMTDLGHISYYPQLPPMTDTPR